MEPVDVSRLKEAARFLKEDEVFIAVMADIEIKLSQGRMWLHVGMKSRHTGYSHGRNSDIAMQADNNIEYWIYKEIKHMSEELAVV